MNIQVYFFTRTGNSERIARKVAKSLSCGVFRIDDDANWQGIGAYLKFKAYAKHKKILTVVSDGNPNDADELVIVSPVWGSRLPPTVQQFIAPIDKKHIHIVTSSLMDPLRGGEEFKSVTPVIRIKKDEDARIEELAARLHPQ